MRRSGAKKINSEWKLENEAVYSISFLLSNLVFVSIMLITYTVDILEFWIDSHHSMANFILGNSANAISCSHYQHIDFFNILPIFFWFIRIGCVRDLIVKLCNCCFVLNVKNPKTFLLVQITLTNNKQMPTLITPPIWWNDNGFGFVWLFSAWDCDLKFASKCNG